MGKESVIPPIFFSCVIVMSNGGRIWINNSTYNPLGYMVEFQKEYTRNCDVKLCPGGLLKFCVIDWPLCGLSWPKPQLSLRLLLLLLVSLSTSVSLLAFAQGSCSPLKFHMHLQQLQSSPKKFKLRQHWNTFVSFHYPVCSWAWAATWAASAGDPPPAPILFQEDGSHPWLSTQHKQPSTSLRFVTCA